MKTLILSDQEASELQEFYMRELARAQRRLSHCQQILSKFESPVEITEIKPKQVTATNEPIAGEVYTEKKKRGRPRKDQQTAGQAIAAPEAALAAPKKIGRPRKEKPVLEKGETPEAEVSKNIPQPFETESLAQEMPTEVVEENIEIQTSKKLKKAGKKADKVETKSSKKTIKQSEELGIKIPWTSFIMDTLKNATHPLTAKEIANIAIKQYEIPDKKTNYVRNTIAACLSGLATRSKKIDAIATEAKVKAYLLPPSEN